MGLVVVAVADVGGCDEELKRVVLVQVQRPRFDFLLQLLHALLAIAARASWGHVKASAFLHSMSHTGPGDRAYLLNPRSFL